MRWNVRKTESHYENEKKFVRKFAFCPTKLEDDSTVWFGFYYQFHVWLPDPDRTAFSGTFWLGAPLGTKLESEETHHWFTNEFSKRFKYHSSSKDVKEWIKEQSIGKSDLMKVLNDE